MKLNEFSILADENIFQDIVDFLREKDFDVVSVKELNLQGSSDLELIHLANEEERVILTQDSDFGKIVFTNEIDFVGIIYIRPGHFPPKKHLTTLATLIESDIELHPSFTLTAELKKDNIVKIRLRNNV